MYINCSSRLSKRMSVAVETREPTYVRRRALHIIYTIEYIVHAHGRDSIIWL